MPLVKVFKIVFQQGMQKLVWKENCNTKEWAKKQSAHFLGNR